MLLIGWDRRSIRAPRHIPDVVQKKTRWMKPSIKARLHSGRCRESDLLLAVKCVVVITVWAVITENRKGHLLYVAINKMANKLVDSNWRSGVCRSFHVIREFDFAAGWRCLPVP